jgi:hypothetical protein
MVVPLVHHSHIAVVRCEFGVVDALVRPHLADTGFGVVYFLDAKRSTSFENALERLWGISVGELRVEPYGLCPCSLGIGGDRRIVCACELRD